MRLDRRATHMKPPRIPVSAVPGGMQSPFAALEIDGLPEGPVASDPSPEKNQKKSGRGRVVLRREKARRGGKTVVVVSGFCNTIPETQIEDLARDARQACGCGGTVRLREIELQGDQPERVRQFFLQAGFQVAGV